MKVVFPEKLLPRDVLTEILPFLEEENIIVLLGARQTGKTSLLYLLIQHLLKKGLPEQQIIYFDLENIHDFNKLDSLTDFNDFLEMLKDYGVDSQQKVFVFIDEIQHLANPSSFLKYLHDHYKSKLKFIVTGSSSLEIKKKFSDRLTGRIYRFLVQPLCFKEFLVFKKETELAQKITQLGLPAFILDKKKEKYLSEITVDEEKRLQRLVSEYITLGGYPAIAQQENFLVKEKELQEIYSLYIRRDIKDIGEIEDVTGYNKLVSLLGFQIGNLVNEQELSISSGLSRPTVKKYLFLLENTFVLSLVPPFFTNKRTEITKTPKVYFADTGLRNGVVNNFDSIEKRVDTGQLLENFVFSELAKKDNFADKIRFWRTQAKNEVDFIWQEDLAKFYPIEVKSKFSSKRPFPSGLKNFIKNYKLEKAFIVHLGSFEKLDYQGTSVFLLPAWAV